MTRYKVLERCFVDNRLYDEGETITYKGPPLHFLEAIEAEETVPPESEGEEPEKAATPKWRRARNTAQ